MITKIQLREHLKSLKEQLKALKKQINQKQQEIEEQIKATHILLGTTTQPRNRKGVHLDIRELIGSKGPLTLAEITNYLTQMEKLVSSKQPRTTVYYALKRRNQDFYQGENKKWYLRDRNEINKEKEKEVEIF